jgi:hypothetical protein
VSGSHNQNVALAMLTTFASVGARSFDVTLLDTEGKEQGYQSNRSLEELRRSMGRRLEAATGEQLSIVIRPRSTTATLIQLDDFDQVKAERMEPYAFLTLRTSPGNFQVWLAVTDAPTEPEAAKQFKTRVRRGAGADLFANGATRIAGSLNFKKKYAPAFPCVEITRSNAGSVTTVAALEQAGFVAPVEPLPPASVPPELSRPTRKVTGEKPRYWPDYQQALRGAPRKPDGTPDRSLADFMFCKWAIERGHGTDDTAAKLLEVSDRARERLKLKDDTGYTTVTAKNAEKAVERDRGRRPVLKSAADPR